MESSYHLEHVGWFSKIQGGEIVFNQQNNAFGAWPDCAVDLKVLREDLTLYLVRVRGRIGLGTQCSYAQCLGQG